VTVAEIRRGSGRPKGYHNAAGKRVPGVTTITGRFKDSGGMIYKANEVGRDGLTLEEAWYSSGEVGHAVHKMVEANIHGARFLPVVAEEIREKAMAAYEAWQDWFAGTKLTVEATEIPLVSEEYQFGGTIDCLLRDSSGRLCIGDWKSSNALYGDYLLQIAAYGLLWDETQDEKITGGYHLVRFSKSEGDLEHRHFRNLDNALRMFLLLREAYELDKEVKRRAK
jgi:hypothetical protein